MYVELDGEKVRELREKDEVGVAELARRAGIAPKTLRRVESNQGTVMVKTAKKLAAALQVEPPQWLARTVWTTRSTVGRPTVAHELHA